MRAFCHWYGATGMVRTRYSYRSTGRKPVQFPVIVPKAQPQCQMQIWRNEGACYSLGRITKLARKPEGRTRQSEQKKEIKRTNESPLDQVLRFRFNYSTVRLKQRTLT